MNERNDATEKAPARSAPEFVHPNELVSGKPMPYGGFTFHTPDGTKKHVKLQGLSFAVKSQIDASWEVEYAEAKARGIFKPNLRAALLLAKAVRTPDGKRPFTRDEDEMVYAISLMEQMADGEIGRGYNYLMKLSGYGEESLADAVKE